jgi:Flp pilus assembly protein TadG
MRGAGDRGAAAVEFVLVAGFLLTPLFLGVVQLGLGPHVRNTLVACAGEGARYAANANRSLNDGAQRTRECIASSLRASYADDISASLTDDEGAATITITVRAPMPVVGFVGPSKALVVRGHAFQEQA